MYLPAGRLAGSNESPVSPLVEGARFTPFSRPLTTLRLPSFSESTAPVSSVFKTASFFGELLWMAWCCLRLPCRQNIHGGLWRLGACYLCGEPTITVGALERSLLRVRPHVDLQPAGTTEHLTGDDANLRMTSRELPWSKSDKWSGPGPWESWQVLRGDVHYQLFV